MPTLAELLTAKTKDEIFQELVDALAAMDLPVTDWNIGGVERTHLEVEAQVQADLWALVPLIASSGFLFSELCVGAWVDLLAENFYDEVRNPAVFTVDTIRLTCPAGFGPYTIEAGDLWAANAAGKLFNNTAGGTLAAGGTLDLTFQAESPGSAYNLPRNTITILKTPLPGVTITNITGGLVTSGTDQESDAAYKNRCRLKWASLATGAPDDFYRYWALKADPTITKVKVITQARGQGTVDVVIWGEGGLGAGVPAAAQAFLRTKAPLTDNDGLEAYAATEVTLTLTGTITVKAGYLATAQARVAANLASLQVDTPIAGTLAHAQAVDALVDRDVGVTDAVITTVGFDPDTPLELDDVEALTIVDDMTWVEV
jgi:hypothetical protein